VHGGKNGDGLLGDINTGENLGSLTDTGQTLGKDVSGDVGEIEKHMVLVLACMVD
jgi:hypothetical protein